MKDSKVKFKWKKKGFIAVLESQFMMDAILDEAETQGEVLTSYIAYDRVQALVRSDNANRGTN